MVPRLRAGPAPLAPLLASVRLVRPLNLVAIAMAAWVGARLAGASPAQTPASPLPLAPAAAILVPVLIGAFGYARNDASDLAADRYNRPDRPLPAGDLSPRAARVLSLATLFGAIALVAAARRDAASATIAASAVLLLGAYSPWLKDRGPAGPAAIALLTVLAVVWGGVGGAALERTLLPALLAGAVQFARECVKQLEDAPGDRGAGRRTWAVASGAAVVKRGARVALLGALLLLPLPVTAGGVRARYLVAAAPTAGLLVLGAMGALGGIAPRYGRVSAALKAALFFGLAALAWGA